MVRRRSLRTLGLGAALAAGGLARRFGLGRAIIGSCALSAAGLLLWPLARPGHALAPLLIGSLMLGFGVPVYNVTESRRR